MSVCEECGGSGVVTLGGDLAGEYYCPKCTPYLLNLDDIEIVLSTSSREFQAIADCFVNNTGLIFKYAPMTMNRNRNGSVSVLLKFVGTSKGVS